MEFNKWRENKKAWKKIKCFSNSEKAGQK